MDFDTIVEDIISDPEFKSLLKRVIVKHFNLSHSEAECSKDECDSKADECDSKVECNVEEDDNDECDENFKRLLGKNETPLPKDIKIKIVNCYSTFSTGDEKSFVIIGDTIPIKDTLKAMGGKFSFNFTISKEKVAGWVFSSKNRSKVMNKLRTMGISHQFIKKN